MIITKTCSHFRIHFFQIKGLNYFIFYVEQIQISRYQTKYYQPLITIILSDCKTSSDLILVTYLHREKGFYDYLLWQQMNWELHYKDNTFLFFAFCLLDGQLALAVVYAKHMLLTSHFPESFFLLICAPIISSM